MKIITPNDLSNFAPEEEPPKGIDGKLKKKFAVKEEMTTGQIPGPFFHKNIYIDNELFDWEIDEDAYKWAENQGPEILFAVQKDIINHFLNSISEFTEKKITLKDLQEAIRTGWI
jgi:hypothetical protein